MNEKNPLTEDDLKNAAYFSLAAASWTDMSEISGNLNRQDHHQRRKRFNKALKKMERGITSLSDLGLLAKDCAWATSKTEKILKDAERWLSRFQEAENIIKEAS